MVTDPHLLPLHLRGIKPAEFVKPVRNRARFDEIVSMYREITRWNCANVRYLQHLLHRMENLLKQEGLSIEYFVNFRQLPTYPFPPELREKGVVAVDVASMALVWIDGKSKIVHVSDLLNETGETLDGTN